LGVGADGAAWARTETTTVCGSVSNRLVRFERGAWAPVSAPQFAQSSHGLSVLGNGSVFTVDTAFDSLIEYDAGDWRKIANVEDAWSVFARSPNEVWVGGNRNSFGVYDGAKYTELKAATGGRAIEEIVAIDGETWMVARGFVEADTDTHVYRFAGGELTEWNHGVPPSAVHLAALDRAHVWVSGKPARFWNGTAWADLDFEASGVWARNADEVWFTRWGDIFRYDVGSATVERVYHGFIPIWHIAGAGDRAFAVGPGGLTLELGVWPETK